MAHDDPDDPIWSRVLALAEDCGGEANDFHAVDEMDSDPRKPLYVLVHPGDIVQSDNDVAYSEDAEAIQEYSRQCQSGVEHDVERLEKYGWDLAVLHRFSSSYGFGVSNCIQEFTESIDTIHDVGLVMFGDNLREAADYLIAEMDALARPAIVLSGAWSGAEDGCIAALGQMLQDAGARVHLADSACISPDGDGEEWKPQRPSLGHEEEKALVPEPKIAFQDDMEGPDGILINVLSSPVTLQPDIIPGRYFRFGPGNPIVRLKAMTPDAMSRIYTFELADGQEVPYGVNDILDRMKRGVLERIRPTVVPVARMHETLLGILAHGATCLAATIEGLTSLSRLDRAAIAREVAQAKTVQGVIDTTQADRAGIILLERAIGDLIAHEREAVRIGQERGGPAGKIRRHQDIANALETARSALTNPHRGDNERSRQRLAAAIDSAAKVPQPRRRAG
jgi:hypothetical protein